MLGSPVLVLPLLGAGSFLNNWEWTLEGIGDMWPTIQRSGLCVVLTVFGAPKDLDRNTGFDFFDGIKRWLNGQFITYPVFNGPARTINGAFIPFVEVSGLANLVNTLSVLGR